LLDGCPQQAEIARALTAAVFPPSRPLPLWRLQEDGCKKGCTGFGAVAGWDATTGFGTPNIPVLIAALAAL